MIFRGGVCQASQAVSQCSLLTRPQSSSHVKFRYHVACRLIAADQIDDVSVRGLDPCHPGASIAISSAKAMPLERSARSLDNALNSVSFDRKRCGRPSGKSLDNEMSAPGRPLEGCVKEFPGLIEPRRIPCRLRFMGGTHASDGNTGEVVVAKRVGPPITVLTHFGHLDGP